MNGFLAYILPVGGGHPAHPIAPGGGFPVDPGYGVPMPPGVPTHPIAGFPGFPAHPIAPPLPVFPTHPISPGGNGDHPDNTLPEMPPQGYLVVWTPQHGFVMVKLGPDRPRPDQGLPLGPEPR